LIATTPVIAQVQSRPTDPPVVTAANESWYVNGEPLQFAGDLYYPAGARVFFNGNTMVRSGHYNGVPLHTDTTIAPYSIVYVPIQLGLVQPYERPRQGVCRNGRKPHTLIPGSHGVKFVPLRVRTGGTRSFTCRRVPGSPRRIA
jgi:hypothetical protein